ncbi:hypothetical protein D9757_014993 [Collybiopsis confluens]|uniref:Protein kinase domain-containing protein n=1 Tax=Collybiopsis confluens TaxID=2823264 RepID=A0A8H5CC55_9AGAR|nr:hypothetical protein D9757_014993 [Collybiopsis confluens]
MTEPLHCYVFCVKNAWLYPGFLDVLITENSRAGDLSSAVAGQQKVTPAQIVLWKERIASAEVEKLRRILRHGKLEDFCYPVTYAQDPTRTIKSLISAGPNSRTSTYTALIAEIFPEPPPIAPKIEPDDNEEQEETDYLSKMKTGTPFVFSFYPALHIHGSDFESVLTVKRDTPSQSCQPLKYVEYQARVTPVYDGRYAEVPNTTAAPIEIYHPVFAFFLGCLRDRTKLKVDSSLLKKTHKIMRSTSKIATSENQRETATREFLADILGCGIQQNIIDRKAIPDHVVSHNLAGEKVAGNAGLAIVEEKSEIGTSGDAVTQGTFSYLAYWGSPDQKGIRDVSFCPSFLVSLAGPWMAISGAIFTSGIIVQRLTDYVSLGESRVIDHRRLVEVAQVFLALRLSIARLRAWYDELSNHASPSDHRYFPLATSFTAEGKTTSFRYQSPLKNADPTCTVFLASEVDGPRKFVVKFVERYGEDVHRELAAINRAPELLYCGPIWPSSLEQLGAGELKMVVMEYLEGKTLAKRKKTPESVRKSVESVIRALHAKGWVHGDIRPPNVLIVNSKDEPDVKEADRVRVLDFDWAGADNEVCYPSDLLMDSRPASAGDFLPILKAHDLFMINAL